MYENPEAEFNVAIANAQLVHELRASIYQAKADNEYNRWFDLLEDITTEVLSFYDKHKNNSKKLKEHIEKIKTLEENSAKALKSKNTFFMKTEFMEWTRYIIARAYEIWFSRDRDPAKLALMG